MKSNNMEWPMRREVSHQQKSCRVDETLRALVRLLARAAAREALTAAPKKETEEQRSFLPGEGSNHAE